MVFEFCCPNDGTPHWVDESCIGKEILCVTCSSMIEVQDQTDGVERQRSRDAVRSRKARANRALTAGRKQKWVLLCGIALVVLASLYPPWQFVLHGPQGTSGSRRVGHSFSEPRYSDYYNPMEHPIPCGQFSHPWSDGKCYASYADDAFYNSNPSWIEVKVDLQILAVEWVTLILVASSLVWLWRPTNHDPVLNR